MLGNITAIAPTAASIAGLGAMIGGTKMLNMIHRGTKYTDPLSGPPPGIMYGKRGIDANNHSTQGLVQGLYKNRRKF